MFNPDVVIEGKRIRLRFLKKEDTEAIFNNINHDKEVLTYFIDNYLEKVEDMTLERRIKYCLENQRYFLAIEIKETNEVIGMILQCSTPDRLFTGSEIGYAIGKKYWNHGYTSEAFSLLIDYLFKSGVHKIVASHLIGNDASKRVMEKNGLIYEGRRIDEVYYHDRYYNVDYYYLINPLQKQ